MILSIELLSANTFFATLSNCSGVSDCAPSERADVYKRQTVSCSLEIDGVGFTPALNITGIPVSYTHLDVYKRQSLVIVIASSNELIMFSADGFWDCLLYTSAPLLPVTVFCVVQESLVMYDFISVSYTHLAFSAYCHLVLSAVQPSRLLLTVQTKQRLLTVLLLSSVSYTHLRTIKPFSGVLVRFFFICFYRKTPPKIA